MIFKPGVPNLFMVATQNFDFKTFRDPPFNLTCWLLKTGRHLCQNLLKAMWEAGDHMRLGIAVLTIKSTLYARILVGLCCKPWNVITLVCIFMCEYINEIHPYIRQCFGQDGGKGIIWNTSGYLITSNANTRQRYQSRRYKRPVSPRESVHFFRLRALCHH